MTVSPARIAKLRALNAVHAAWVRAVLDEGDVPFSPDQYDPKRTVYNLHTVDIEADGDAQDEYALAAGRIMQPHRRAS